MKFCSSGEKMSIASGNQGEKSNGENKKRKRTRTTFNSSIKRVTRKFLEVSRCSRAKQWQRNAQKIVCCTFKVAFFANSAFA